MPSAAEMQGAFHQRHLSTMAGMEIFCPKLSQKIFKETVLYEKKRKLKKKDCILVKLFQKSQNNNIIFYEKFQR